MRGFIQVDIDAIRTNIQNLHKNYPRETGVMAVIKSDAYGHGAAAIGKAIENMDCLYGFAVATSDEAFELRDEGIKPPILVMGPVFSEDFESLIQNNISIIIFNEVTIDLLNDCAVRLNEIVSVHIEVDTWMNRVGIKPDENGFLFVKKIAGCSNLRIDGIYTHFAKADEADKENTLDQINQFHAFIDQLENELDLSLRIKHSSNSAGMLGFTDFPLSFCRPGIAIYGIWPSNETKDFSPAVELVPALSLYSQVIMLKDLPVGEAISYGGTYVTSRPTRVATLPIGYGDGYPRDLSNVGYVLIRGKRAPIIGRICMDFVMVDVSDIADVELYDKVTLIGSDGGECITVEVLSALSGRFHYEIVCGLGKRLPRVYKGE